jgi:hypothetical protein
MRNEYYIDKLDNVVLVYLKYKGETMSAMIDIEDFSKIEEFPNTWFPKPSNSGFYMIGRYRKDPENKKWTYIQAHRLIMDAPKGKEVDHINHETLDNRKENLRVVSKSVNQLNRNKGNKTNKLGIRGVHFDEKIGKYRAQIQINKIKYHLGLHKTAEEAAEAIHDILSKKKSVIEVVNNYKSIKELVQ